MRTAGSSGVGCARLIRKFWQITAVAPALDRYPDFQALIAAGEEAEMFTRLRKAETIGRPVGDAAFLQALERESGRTFTPAKRGRKATKSALSP